MLEDDFALCSQTCGRIAARLDPVSRLDQLSDSSRAVLLVWHATGIIDNGGFEYLFEGDIPGDLDCSLTVKAFETIGLLACATALHEALSMLPRCTPFTDVDFKSSAYRLLPMEKRMELNRRFWHRKLDGNDEVVVRLAPFIRGHRADFD